MSLDLIHRVLETPSKGAIEALLESSSVFHVDWRQRDDETIFDCARCVGRSGSLTAEWDPGLRIHFDGRVAEVPLTHGVADRHITLVTLNALLRPDFEVRYCLDSLGSSTGAFIVLSASDWESLTRRWGSGLDQRFYRLQAEPNVFTDLLPVDPPPVLSIAPASGWRALVEEAQGAPNIVESLPDALACTLDTDLVLDQLARGTLDLERLRGVVDDAPKADRPLVRMVLALRDGSAQSDEPTALVLDALRYLPYDDPNRAATILATVQKLGEAPGLDVLTALDRALATVIKRANWSKLALELRQRLTRLVNDCYQGVAQSDAARFRNGRWAPLCIADVGDRASLDLLVRFTRDVPEFEDCPARRAKWGLETTLDHERFFAADAPLPPPAAHAALVRVRHPKFGEGVITATLEGDKVEARFGDQTKRLVRSVLEVLES